MANSIPIGPELDDPTEPGYYEDPLNPQRLRYHDGQRWTQVTRYPGHPQQYRSGSKPKPWSATFTASAVLWLLLSSFYPVMAAFAGAPIDWFVAAVGAASSFVLVFITFVLAGVVNALFGARWLASTLVTVVVFVLTIVVITAIGVANDPYAAQMLDPTQNPVPTAPSSR